MTFVRLFREAREQARLAARQAEFDRTHYVSDGLALDLRSVHGIRDDVGLTISGVVTNNSDDNKPYVEIRFKILNSAGEQLDDAMTNTENLGPGESWRFKAISLEDNAVRYELDTLSDSPFGDDSGASDSSASDDTDDNSVSGDDDQ